MLSYAFLWCQRPVIFYCQWSTRSIAPYKQNASLSFSRLRVTNGAKPRHKIYTSCGAINKDPKLLSMVFFTQTDANDALATVTIKNANYDKLNTQPKEEMRSERKRMSMSRLKKKNENIVQNDVYCFAGTTPTSILAMLLFLL